MPSSHQRGKLREILNDTSIDWDERTRVVSALIHEWVYGDQSDAEGGHEEEPRIAQEEEITGMSAEVLPLREEQECAEVKGFGLLASEETSGAIATEPREELPDCGDSHVSVEVSSHTAEGVTSKVDTGDGTQSMVVLDPSEEQRAQEQLLPEEETSDDGTMEDLMGYGDEEGTSIRHGAVDVLDDEVGVSVKAMDKVELEEVFDLGVIEIGVSADEPEAVDELKVSGTWQKKRPGRRVRQNTHRGALFVSKPALKEASSQRWPPLTGYNY